MQLLNLISIIIPFLLIGFWAWMLYDFVHNDRIAPNERHIWIIGFIFLSVLTAGYYYFTVYRAQH